MRSWPDHGKAVSVLQYFTGMVEDYWHILYPLTPEEDRKADPYLYFYDISRKATDFHGPFDKKGIYLFEGYDGKWHLHALEIAQYALACWLAWREKGETVWLEKALLHCDWLVGYQEENGAWYIEHKNPRYPDLPSPWPSGMAQGLAVSALLRAYRYSGNPSYMESAVKAVEFLELGIDEGGVKRSFDQSGVSGFIYEEYPRRHLSGVLNGYISSILGIRELAEIDFSGEKLFVSNLENLFRILPLYDTGFWSLYSLDGNFASGFYHRLVCRQLRVLGGEKHEFAEYAERFEAYLECKACVIKALFRKASGRLFL
jgi:hypothetical protein